MEGHIVSWTHVRMATELIILTLVMGWKCMVLLLLRVELLTSEAVLLRRTSLELLVVSLGTPLLRWTFIDIHLFGKVSFQLILAPILRNRAWCALVIGLLWWELSREVMLLEPLHLR